MACISAMTLTYAWNTRKPHTVPPTSSPSTSSRRFSLGRASFFIGVRQGTVAGVGTNGTVGLVDKTDRPIRTQFTPR